GELAARRARGFFLLLCARLAGGSRLGWRGGLWRRALRLGRPCGGRSRREQQSDNEGTDRGSLRSRMTDKNVCPTTDKKSGRTAWQETARRNRADSCCHNQRLLIRLRHGACQEKGERPGRSRPGAAYLEDHVVAGLQTPGNPAPVAQVLDGLVIHFLDHVAAPETHVFAEAGWVNLSHDHAAGLIESKALLEFRRDVFHMQSEVGGALFPGLVVTDLSGGREEFGAIGHADGGRVVLLVAHVSDLDATADRRGDNWIHQVISGKHGLPVHGSDHVARLEPRLVCRAARLDALDHDAVLDTEFLEQRGVIAAFLVEGDADGTARD